MPSVGVPICFKPVPDDADSLDPKLSHLFSLAVPAIVEILVLMDISNPVIRSYRARFKNDPVTARKSIEWMRSCSLEPSPALEAMLAESLAALTSHELMRSDADASHKIWGLGSVLLQLLAIQHSLGEPWDLNGNTFSHIQTGLLVTSTPRGLDALHAMWLCMDPISIRSKRQLTVAQLATFDTKFKADHTVYDTPTRVAFFRRVAKSDVKNNQRASIRIKHNGLAILLAADLPQSGMPTPVKRKFDGVDVFDGRQQVKASRGSRKWQPKPTPPNVRRSSRNKARHT